MCAHVLTFAYANAICKVMTMARYRNSKNVSLDPEITAQFQKWCDSQDIPVTFARALDLAMKEFLERRSGFESDDTKKGQGDG